MIINLVNFHNIIIIILIILLIILVILMLLKFMQILDVYFGIILLWNNMKIWVNWNINIIYGKIQKNKLLYLKKYIFKFIIRIVRRNLPNLNQKEISKLA